MKLAKRLDLIPPYIFNEIDKLKAKMKNPVDFGIGDPDLPTPKFIIEEAYKYMKKSENHQYPSYTGMKILREEIAKYFDKRFNVSLDPDKEIIVLIGSKEGIAHSLQALINKNDEVLLPSISYPVYRVQSKLWGAKVKEFSIKYENKFIPEIKDIEKKISNNTKILFLNYPNNPTSAIVPFTFYKDIIKLAKQHNFIILNDAVYSEVYYSKIIPHSILEADKNKKYSLEFHSFSKTFNMTGWRIGFAVGNKHLIEALKKIKMNTDSGVFNPIQYAAIKALQKREEHIEKNNKIIANRVDMLCETLDKLNFDFHKPQATFYVFAKTKFNMKSMDFTKYLMKKANIITAPGIGFGKDGDKFVRFSVTLSERELKRGIKNLKKLM